MLTAPVASLIVGILAVVGVLATLWQRQRSEQKDRAHRIRNDDRAEWWKRCQWAIEQATNPPTDEANRIGFAVLTSLSRSPLVGDSERDIIRAVAILGPGEDTEDEDTEGGAQ